MRLALALMLVATAAHADLYRWVDPQTGAVKFSSVPPPSAQPGVEVIPYRGGAAAPTQSPAAAAAPLELRWRELLAGISSAVPGSADLPQRLQDFAAVSTELDRVDPAGAEQRRTEARAVLQRLLEVQK